MIITNCDGTSSKIIASSLSISSKLLRFLSEYMQITENSFEKKRSIVSRRKIHINSLIYNISRINNIVNKICCLSNSNIFRGNSFSKKNNFQVFLPLQDNVRLEIKLVSSNLITKFLLSFRMILSLDYNKIRAISRCLFLLVFNF